MKIRESISIAVVAMGLGVAGAGGAKAAETASVEASGVAVPPPAAPKPPYSLPWQLRPVVSATVLRSDTSVAFYDAPDGTTDKAGSAVATTFLASYKLSPTLMPLVRWGLVRNAAPELSGKPQLDGTAFLNPLLGLAYVKAIGPYKLSGFGAVTAPVGSGGGNAPDAGTRQALTVGIPARSAMDNAMFAVNYFTMIAGADAAYVAHKLTVQAEFTVLELLRARGADVDKDSARTNFTAGLHVGYFVVPMLSLGGELRYQRWLTDAAPVKANPAARESVTVAIGPRFHFKVGEHWLRPGVSYSRYLDAPFSKSHYHMVQIDVPFIF